MAIQRTDGILLKRQEIRETSLILTVFTRELGKIQGLCKGVRGARAAVPWYLEPLTLQALVLYERKRSAWVLISSCDLLDAYDPIRKDLVRTAYASVCLELTEAMTETHDPHPEIFRLLDGTLSAMSRGAEPKGLVCAFSVHLVRMAGLLPEAGRLSLSEGAKRTFEQILNTPAGQIGQLRLNRQVEEELTFYMRQRIRTVLERELKTILFLYEAGLESEQAARMHYEIHRP